ncbi:secretin N-terminal domain-containing protein [Thalassotalea marina]|uniref:Type II secretion system protein GspD n=1 Tax=Thalassotalea marina TaxID=1673741 RepID=A0A919BCV4_9GAMM|nr:secretin N-terminal domain-containing protein [Thalassotalea marina]GHF80896.1 type II secretion system protein GspD [Thalassotalea marina]
MKNKNIIIEMSLTCLLVLSLSACSVTDTKKRTVEASYLKGSKVTKQTLDSEKNSEIQNPEYGTNLDVKNAQMLTGFNPALQQVKVEQNLIGNFSSNALVTITSDNLPLNEYLHTVFGELLKVNYVLGENVKNEQKQITLNLQSSISEKKLFELSEKLIRENGYEIRLEDGIYYIHKAQNNAVQGSVTFGYGKNIDKVPAVASTIVQLIPFEYGMQTSLANTLKQLLSIKAMPDFERNTLILQGKRAEIIKALELIHLLDRPLFKNRHIGTFKTRFVSNQDLVKKLPELLKQDGVSVSGQNLNDLAVSLVSLDRIGTVVIFANNQALIDRTLFWADQIDQAPSGNEKQYFIYQPQFARATDLGTSLSVLISGGGIGDNRSAGNTTSAERENNSANTSSQISAQASSNSDMTMVVDERANSLIFSTTGNKYRQFLPLIKRLDVMPRQVILEVVIAEVKLSDDYKQGVEFELTNQGVASKVGGFNLKSNASGLSYVLTGADGRFSLNLMQKNTNINVLSRPSLLVRDGVTANITVGDDIPTVGSIVTDPVNGSQTSIVYRKTGVELRVKPTINARGVVIMEIDQKISNQESGGSSVEGAPIIFERSIDTEVVAESGQTIILGGLISENRTVNDKSVPFFSSIPVIGSLFDSTEDSSGKTELVVMVTPKVIDSGEEWSDIKTKFISELTNIDIN